MNLLGFESLPAPLSCGISNPVSFPYSSRIGRSGRFGRKGVAINFVKSDDIRILRDIEQYYSTQIDEMPMNGKYETHFVGFTASHTTGSLSYRFALFMRDRHKTMLPRVLAK